MHRQITKENSGISNMLYKRQEEQRGNILKPDHISQGSILIFCSAILYSRWHA